MSAMAFFIFPYITIYLPVFFLFYFYFFCP